MIEKKLKAGAIILSNKDNDKIALLHRGKQNDWSFPKGHIDSGENEVEAMVREIREETGLTIEIIRVLPDIEYHNENEGIVSVKMFLVKSKDDSELKKEFESDHIEWVQSNLVTKTLSYNNLINYYNSILPTLKNTNPPE